jgi:hypothetical protein
LVCSRRIPGTNPSNNGSSLTAFKIFCTFWVNERLGSGVGRRTR